MSKLWDDLKHNMKEWSSAAVEKAEEVSKVAVAKTEELTKISKIKLEVHQLQRDIRKARQALGKLAYDHAKDANMVNFTGNAEFYSYVEKIDSIKDEIGKKENEIDFIKSQYNIPEEDVKEIEPLSEKLEEEDKEPNENN
jgi:predicted  nucleic acid-binding Zn-ribbon protein